MIEIRKPDALLKKLLPSQKPLPDVRYVPSQFALPFVHRNRHYVFHTLTKQCVEAILPEHCSAGEGYDELIEDYFLVPEGKDECGFYQSLSAMMRAYSRKKGEKGYTILPTLCCNARCVYCYEEGRQPLTMSPETVEQTIRYLIDSHAGDRVMITWFGGEPLLCVSVIDRVCEGLREAGVDYKCSMVSNGSLITPAIADKMISDWHLKKIQISMDGAERDYIKRKRYFRDEGQYRTVLHAVDLLTERGISVAIRCNVDWENIDGVAELLDDLKAAVRSKEQVIFYLSPLFDVCGADNSLAFWRKVIDAQQMIASAGFRPFLLRSIKRSFRVSFCMADSGGVVICPDGVLSPCEHLQQATAFGDVWHGVTDEAARREFCRTDRIREMCRKCPFLPECTGFSSCPTKDAHCRELREMVALDTLRQMVDHPDTESDEAIYVC